MFWPKAEAISVSNFFHIMWISNLPRPPAPPYPCRRILFLIIFILAILDHFQRKMFKFETTSFHIFFPKDSKSLKILDIRLRKVGAKRCFNITSKVNTRTDRQTDRRTDRHFDLQKASTQRVDALKIVETKIHTLGWQLSQSFFRQQGFFRANVFNVVLNTLFSILAKPLLVVYANWHTDYFCLTQYQGL